ncbi:Peptidase M48 Ste24p [Planktothrix tepida]|uniref:Peptidase M48 Ste24p n=1 Tax=Planktothrix tepida PCC 9214 TaxID=671072 RepID=A0A1J1LTK8_9CYAN|nr:M48 family metalloprotease [Planktothrix tepida]CAD5976860.1 Peptidase M48 Ste24p [Planktothrix tepida]CUR35936.1 Peptidase M48 Ste24p [Planktothrix tepida PCC 9214]
MFPLLQSTQKLAILTCLSTLFFPTPLLAESLNPESVLMAQNPSNDEFYKQAKEELSEDVYVIYRVVDRIARANGLDNTPWRVGIVDEYNINAFATEVNLIAIYTGILDQLAGDSSAIACVIGHEMAHHVKRHIALGPAEEAALKERIQKEAEEQVLAEIQDAKSDATGTSVGGAVLQTVGGFLGGWGRTAGNVGNSALQGASRQRLAQAEERVKEIVQEKTTELEQKLAENNRKQEFEADEVGYQYIAKAGFDAEGCIRVMDVLGRTSGAEFDTTHPAIPKRVEQLRALMNQYPPATLAQEGESLIKSTQPLTYDLSKDGQSLRINSRRGGSAADDIDRRFGQ